ncbi:MAG TPA: hypothetical protein VFU64_05380 [Gaiellaceae bacterium]|nr:hypothetical protein [Gaiellaceae bacterium]
MKKLVALVGATAAIALSGMAGAASASPSTTPNGYIGACNMLLDPTMLTVAMAKDGGFSSPGSVGMFTATGITSGDPLCGLGG